MKTEHKIAQDIKALVTQYVKEEQHPQGLQEIDDLKETIECMVEIVQDQLFEAGELVKDSEEKNLTLNQLGAEGSVRACLIILDDFKKLGKLVKELVKGKELE